MVMGVPGRIVRTTNEKDREATAWSVEHYQAYAREQMEKMI